MSRYLAWLAVLWIGCAAPSAPAQSYAPHPSIDVVHYAFDLALSDTTDTIRGEATVDIRFRADTLSAFRLDLIGKKADGTGMSVTRVAEGGTSLDFSQANDEVRIQLDDSPVADEQRTFAIAYTGQPADGLIIAQNQHGDRTFFGDNWPNRARHWLPVVDHPSDKATVEFAVTAPARYEVISNGARVDEASLAGDRRRTRWRAAEPLPTKVMVIGVADFAVDTVGTYDDTAVQSWVYPEDRQRGFAELGQALRILEYFEPRLGNFPYAKLANVQSTTRYGGMENAAAIFYSERAVSDRENDEPLLAHEIAHQWYGDAVTETDWPHLWLSEGFATYLTQLYLEDTYGVERRINGMQRARERVIRFHQQAPDEPLVDTTYADPTELLNTNPYQKGAWVLHMLRREVGDDAFWDGLRAYFERFKHQNASTADFRAVMEDVSGQDLAAFFTQWTRRAGHPVVEASWSYDETAGQLTLQLAQAQDGAPFTFPLEVAIHTADGDTTVTVPVDAQRETYTFDDLAAPTDLQLDPNAWVLMEATVTLE